MLHKQTSFLESKQFQFIIHQIPCPLHNLSDILIQIQILREPSNDKCMTQHFTIDDFF